MTNEQETLKRIKKLRTMLTMHRYLYYVLASSLISDQRYDALETELKKLVADNPQLEAFDADSDRCPTKTVGSSNPDDYTPAMVALAERVLEQHQKENRA